MSTPKRVYLAGPMRGLPGFNFPRFHGGELTLRRFWSVDEVFNPAREDELAGFRPHGLTGNEDLAALGFDLAAAQERDHTWIREHATHIALLPGWGASQGARGELALALSLDLGVIVL